MAEYLALRKGKNFLSSAMHILLNLALAVASTVLTVISGNWIFGILLVVLSKWRVVAVRPRYWWLNIKSNLVDFVVGISLVLLVYYSGTDEVTAWHIILTAIYAIWLVVVKPRTSILFVEIQAFFAIFFGSFALTLATAHIDPLLGCVSSFIVGYSASRHILTQTDDRDFTLTTFIAGMLLAELSWIFYHWSIVYRIESLYTVIAIPQLPIAASLIFFVFTRGYSSALRHDGKIRSEDIVMPVVFLALLMFLMIFFFSKASFDV